ncbi:hypothetical protein R3P38DRAFT_3123725 [Favolaschia claudopus]|uniref:F-box domain-containing protein n=1 Tax=Favolaschia claudopus TaxID=2862362 RepID=A0AAV9ZD29_9AGAR
MSRGEDGGIPLDSPFHDYLNTNYAPTDVEISQIRAHLPPYEEELARLDALIQDLSAQRDRIIGYVDSHRALISHPRRLPQDIVGEIFLACLPTQRNAIMSASEAPLLLGRVCSRWRSIAYALPRLWCSLHISADFVDSEELQDVVTDWLTRASLLPLAISVHWSTSLGYEYDDIAIDTLLPFSSRWSALQLVNIPDEEFSSVAESDAPLLADIVILFERRFGRRGYYEDEENPPEASVLKANVFFGQNLQRIAITTREPTYFVPTVPFTWDHITDVVLKASGGGDRDRFDVPAVYRLLKGCPRLRSLELPMYVGYGAEAEVQDDLLTLPTLEALSIRNDSNVSELFENFLDTLLMPRLNKLHLTNSNINAETADPPILERLAQHAPLLSDIRLELFSFWDTITIIRGLQPFPHVEKLGIVLWSPEESWHSLQSDESELFDVLSPDSDANPVPALREMSLETQDFGEKPWVDCLRKHLLRKTGFRRFHLHLWCDGPRDEIDLSELVAGGLDVSVRCSISDEAATKPTPWQGIER